MNRNRDIKQLKEQDFDLCIIGAGASGAGVALDAVLRGFKVCLIDRGDFCSETSSRSTKLIHGGVRYLEQAFRKFDFAQLKQVKHGLSERRILLNLAPHLARPLALITPVFSWFGRMYYSTGLKIYGWIAGEDGMPQSRWLSKEETLKRIPGLTRNIYGSVLYYDGTFDDAAYVLAMVQSAVKQGAVAANYVSFQSFEKAEGGKLRAVFVKNELSGEEFKIKARLFINCTGPFSDTVRLSANPEEESRIRPSKGVHIVFSASWMKTNDALLIPETKDGRVVFVKPLYGEMLAGTTDTLYNELERESVLERSEVDYLLETLRPFLNKTPEIRDIKSGFSGVRPLLAPKRTKRKETKRLLRDHEVEYDEVSGLLSLLGGKWTTYRIMAQDTVDYACHLLGNGNNVCSTETHKLTGAELSGFDSSIPERQLLESGISSVSCKHLLDRYGDRIFDILKLIQTDSSLSGSIVVGYPFILAEVVYAIQSEMAVKIRDFVARRIRLEIMDWHAAMLAAKKIAQIFQRELSWTDEHTAAELAEYINRIKTFQETALKS